MARSKCPNCHVKLDGKESCPCGWKSEARAAASVRCRDCSREADIIRPDQDMPRDDKKIFGNDWGLCWDHYHRVVRNRGMAHYSDAEVDRRIAANELERRDGEPRSEWLARLGKSIPNEGYGAIIKGWLRREYQKTRGVGQVAEG